MDRRIQWAITTDKIAGVVMYFATQNVCRSRRGGHYRHYQLLLIKSQICAVMFVFLATASEVTLMGPYTTIISFSGNILLFLSIRS